MGSEVFAKCILTLKLYQHLLYLYKFFSHTSKNKTNFLNHWKSSICYYRKFLIRKKEKTTNIPSNSKATAVKILIDLAIFPCIIYMFVIFCIYKFITLTWSQKPSVILTNTLNHKRKSSQSLISLIKLLNR